MATQHAGNNVPGPSFMSPEYVPGLVSMIIPTYNRATLVQEAILSAVNQTYTNVEVIVVDDGSTDNTHEVVRALTAKQGNGVLRYLEQEHAGAQVARNRGLIKSRGEYIQFLDSDDILHPSKIEKQVRLLAANTSCDFVYSYATSMTRSGNAVRVRTYPTANWYVRQLHVETVLRLAPQTQAGLFRRRVCERIGPWDESLHMNQDRDYYARFAMAGGQCCFLPEILSYVRSKGRGSTSGQESYRLRFEHAWNAKLIIGRRVRIIKGASKRIGCMTAESLMHTLHSVGRMDSQKSSSRYSDENVKRLSEECRSLNPCWLCKLRLIWLLLFRQCFGERLTATVYHFVRDVRGKFFQIRVRVLWRLGCRYIRPPRQPLHAPKH